MPLALQTGRDVHVQVRASCAHAWPPLVRCHHVRLEQAMITDHEQADSMLCQLSHRIILKNACLACSCQGNCCVDNAQLPDAISASNGRLQLCMRFADARRAAPCMPTVILVLASLVVIAPTSQSPCLARVKRAIAHAGHPGCLLLMTIGHQ